MQLISFSTLRTFLFTVLNMLHLLGMSLLVYAIECCHVPLEVLLQLVEGAHRLIKCPRKKTSAH